MKLTIKINMENAAFVGHKTAEVTRILRKLVDDMNRDGIRPGYDWMLRDVNGNSVGKAEVIGDDDDEEEDE